MSKPRDLQDAFEVHRYLGYIEKDLKTNSYYSGPNNKNRKEVDHQKKPSESAAKQQHGGSHHSTKQQRDPTTGKWVSSYRAK